jgi:transcriptional regulator with XRE-family HTH domain
MPRAHRPPKPSIENLGSRLHKVRVAFGDAQEDIASKLGVTRSSVSQWEHNIVMPTVDKVEAMAHRYNCTFEWLMFGRGDEPALPMPSRRRRQPAGTARSELFVGQTILEYHSHNAKEPSPEWHIPSHALPCDAGAAVFFSAPADLPPIMRGDYVLIDKTQCEIQLAGQWLVELAGSAHPMLVRSRVAKAHERPIIEVISHDDVVFGIRSIKSVIGRVVARFGWL